MAVKAIPEGYTTVTPYLVLKGVPEMIDFLQKAFDAKEIRRTMLPDGTIMNVEMQIGSSMIMMGESRAGMEPMSAMLYLYVEDTDAVYKRALSAGATSVMEPADQFYGDRNAGVQDWAGNQWWIGTHIEDVSDEEMQKRIKEMMDE